VPTLGRLEPAAVLVPGELGTFDDSGVTMSCVVAHAGRRYLYYTGWTRGVTVPFYLFAGLAVSEDDGATYSRLSAAPLLDRSDVDPYLTASPFVLVDEGRWRMWYVSATGWTRQAGEVRQRLHIKYCEFTYVVHWLLNWRVIYCY